MSAISLRQVEKRYRLYRHGFDRLVEALTGRARHTPIQALHPISLEVEPGEVVGVIGRNGAGKSTLLKLIAGTMPPSAGEIVVNGRVTALLELGSGFHPEMSGRENIFLSGTIMGLERSQIEALYDGIVDFAGIGGFIDQPVKTYSSGMFVRLAFAVATAVEPDVLVVDEALSVGDGAFARKSFDRIMAFRERGRTIFFCSHSLYQVEALCTRAIWIDNGQMRMVGTPADVIAEYSEALAGVPTAAQPSLEVASQQPQGSASFRTVEVEAEGARGRTVHLLSGRSDLWVHFDFASDPAIGTPTVAMEFKSSDGKVVASVGTTHEGVHVERDSAGNGRVSLFYPRLPLLRGRYSVVAHLLCERGIHVYETVEGAAQLVVAQETLEQGVVTLPHRWEPRAPKQVAGVGE